MLWTFFYFVFIKHPTNPESTTTSQTAAATTTILQKGTESLPPTNNKLTITTVPLQSNQESLLNASHPTIPSIPLNQYQYQVP